MIESSFPAASPVRKRALIPRRTRGCRPKTGVRAAFLILSTVAILNRGRTQEIPNIKVDVRLVSLTATVEDEKGHPVANLRREDFTVFEDGKPQEIAVFNNDEKVPVSLGIAFDTSGSMIDKIEGVQDAVVHFIDTTNPNDDIFVLRFSSHVTLVQDFTDDRRRLKRAVARLEPGGSTALYDAVIRGLEHLQGGRHRKKALLLVTDGNDTSSETTLKDAIGTARHAESIVYALGIGHGEQGSFGHVGDLFRDTVDIEALRSITDATGGRAVLLEGELHRGPVDRIDEAVQGFNDELRKQYSIAYYPTNAERGGPFRHIQIRSRNPSYIVRSREGYFAPSRE